MVGESLLKFCKITINECRPLVYNILIPFAWCILTPDVLRDSVINYMHINIQLSSRIKRQLYGFCDVLTSLILLIFSIKHNSHSSE